MATTDKQGNADATAARLLADAYDAISQYGSVRQGFGQTWEPFGEGGEQHERFKDRLPEARKAYEATLDTLIRYHRAAGAVEALEAYADPLFQWLTCYDDCDLQQRQPCSCGRGAAMDRYEQALAAAQERLAAYAKED